MFQIVCFILSVCVGDGSFSTVEFCDVLSLLFTTAIPAILHCVYARYLDAAMYSRNTDILFHMLCVHPRVCACMHVGMCVSVHSCVHASMCVCVCVCMCVCACVCVLACLKKACIIMMVTLSPELSMSLKLCPVFHFCGELLHNHKWR